MNEESDMWKLALVNLIAKVGLDAAILIIQNIKSAKTIDDAIAALQDTQKKAWADFKTGPVV